MGSYTIVRILLAQIVMQINNFIHLFSSSTFLQLLTENQAKGKDSKEKLGKIITFPFSFTWMLTVEIYRTAVWNLMFIPYLLHSLLHSIYGSTLQPTNNWVLLAVKNVNFYTAFIQLSRRHSLFLLFLHLCLLILRLWVCSNSFLKVC